jgi:hypothetical protein
LGGLFLIVKLISGGFSFKYPVIRGGLFLIVKLLSRGFSFNYPVIQLQGSSLLLGSSQEVKALIIQLSSSLRRPLPYCLAPIRRF